MQILNQNFKFEDQKARTNGYYILAKFVEQELIFPN
ncbi:hypothetical protein RDI58_027589 [Solanum bulbocastanum]|uniref:Uncharacterized protein n=1 Tax=Solanum bulbocastanum TaxID=147425 RepID=A0AAN8T2N2_SOLBU